MSFVAKIKSGDDFLGGKPQDTGLMVTNVATYSLTIFLQDEMFCGFNRNTVFNEVFVTS